MITYVVKQLKKMHTPNLNIPRMRLFPDLPDNYGRNVKKETTGYITLT